MAARPLALVLTVVAVLGLAGCLGARSAPEVPLEELVQYPDRHYLSTIHTGGLTALPLQSGRSPAAGTYRLRGAQSDVEVEVHSAQLPGPGLRVNVDARVTMDPATSRPVLVETMRCDEEGAR